MKPREAGSTPADDQIPSNSDPDQSVSQAAIYARTSSSSQRFGYSIDEQIRRCWKQCDSVDWPVKFIFRDEAESGRDRDRPQFKKMIDRAKQGSIDVVVFWKLDRFCRSLTDLINIEETLNESGVALHSVTEYIDTTSPVGRFNFRNLASAAELESDLTSQRAKMGMHGLAQAHRWPNEKPPLGYRLNQDDRLEILVEEAELVYRIFERYLSELSMPEVAHLINQNNFRTKDGQEWCRQSVQTVLSNELYVGTYRVADFEDTVEEYRILPDELFEKVTEARFRFQHTKPSMSQGRKEAKAEEIFQDYKQTIETDR